MYDRNVEFPRRYRMVKVDGTDDVYEMLPAPGEVYEEGTMINKATLLTDETAALFGLPATAVPDDMFGILAKTGDLHVWRRTQNGVTDYPVSPNPNAYQTGSDAKPAGYTLGAVQSGLFQISPNVTVADGGSDWLIAETVSVSEDGSFTLVSPREQRVIGTSTAEYMTTLFIGKFVSFKGVTLPTAEYPSVFSKDTIYYFPPEASLSKSGYALYVDKYQTVTGYPAIPAGTTIEALGKLGQKAFVGSYIGTGTYNVGNKNKIKSPFKPSSIFVCREYDSTKWFGGIFLPTFTAEFGGNVTLFVDDENNIEWYSTTSAEDQLNISGQRYAYVIT